MKIGVLSDTHVPATKRSLPPVLFDIFKDVDLIIHTGDITELSVLDELRAIAPVEAVAGNMDDPAVRHALPTKKVIQLGKYRAGIMHGKFRIDQQHERIRKEFENNIDIIIYGHSHNPFWGKIDGIYFLNPGSPTDNRHAPYHSVAILEIADELKAEIIRL